MPDSAGFLFAGSWQNDTRIAMRRFILAATTAAAVAVSLPTVSLGAASAAPFSAPAPLKYAPLTQLAQGYDYSGYYYGGWRPACPYRYHWECWADIYGRPSCGCHPEPGLYTGW